MRIDQSFGNYVNGFNAGYYCKRILLSTAYFHKILVELFTSKIIIVLKCREQLV